MKIRERLFAALFLLVSVATCWAASPATPPQLRPGIVCDEATTAIASALASQGWVYVMPQPKSAQAAWGNRDGRTTWWLGYWQNTKTGATSVKQPTKGTGDNYTGDGQAGKGVWRRGGSPPLPSKVEWLCSKNGGVAPK